MKIQFYHLGILNEAELTFAVTSAIYKGKWLYVRHKERNTWEIPGGHREHGESIMATAERELFEETGCTMADIVPICDYSMDDSVRKIFGRLYFANVKKMGQLPISEIEEVSLFDQLPDQLTYIESQPKIYEKTLRFIKQYKATSLK